MIEQLREHSPVKILIQNSTTYAIRLQTIDMMPERRQFAFQRCVTAASCGVPNVLGKETVRVNAAAFGHAVHFERSPEEFHFSNNTVDARGVFSSPGYVYELNPFIISNEHVVRRAFGFLLAILHFKKELSE